MIEATIQEDRVTIWDLDKARDIFEKDYYGKIIENRLELSIIEAALLLEHRRIRIIKNDKEIKLKEFLEYARSVDPRFNFRYVVYRDLRNKGLPTRTGFKFGCDFRVYSKGVTPLKRGPKSATEHTKWIVFSVPENYACSFAELSRAVRLAHNIRANMLWAVVNEENNEVNYFSVTFFKP